MMRTLLLSLCCPGIFGLETLMCQNTTIGLTRRDEKSCTQFHQCTPLGDLAFQCPMGMVYNERQNICDCGDHKLCNGRLVWAPCPRMTGPNICEDMTLGALLPHPRACNVFFQCTTVGPLVFQCPAGTVFNPDINVCDWPHNTNCRDDRRVIKKRQIAQYFGHPLMSWTICNCPPFLGCPCSCVADCGPPRYQPLEVHITPKPTVTTTKGPETTQTLNADLAGQEVQNKTWQMCPSVNREDPEQPVHLPHEQCQFFYKCFLGTPVPLKCPSGLVWNIALDRCDYNSDFPCQI